MIDEINMEWEKSDRLTVAKLNAVKQFNKHGRILVDYAPMQDLSIDIKTMP